MNAIAKSIRRQDEKQAKRGRATNRAIAQRFASSPAAGRSSGT